MTHQTQEPDPEKLRTMKEVKVFLRMKRSEYRSLADKLVGGTQDHTYAASMAKAFSEILDRIEGRPRGYLPEPGWCIGLHVPGAYCSDPACHLNARHLARTANGKR